MKSHRFWVLTFWFYLGILLVISTSAYMKLIPNELSQFPHYDTILHFFLIGTAAFIGHLALKKRKISILFLDIPIVPILVFSCRFIDEIIQKFSPNRSFDPLDLAADLCGIIILTYLAEKVPIKTSSTPQN
ncbi:MAG: VanZ family protein [Calothrix sp. SM1_7_51]|nr:VanZ family protein [Calothrix sp. SM1_7_51]